MLSVLRDRARGLVLLSAPPGRGLTLQILGGVAFGVVIPYLIGSQVFSNFDQTRLAHQTAVGSALAIIASAVVNRNLSTFPGIRAHAFVFASIAASFMTLFAVLLLARLEYSRYLLTAGFCVSVVWFYALAVWNIRHVYRVGVVPYGDVAGLRAIRGIEWQDLDVASQQPIAVSAVVADLRAELPSAWDTALADYALAGIPVFHVKVFKESLTGTVELEHLSENSFGSLMPTFAYFQVKRAIDWVGALILLVLVWPLMIVAAILIRIDTPGPALFKQNRVGYRGRVFTVYKFRTMISAQGKPADHRLAAQTQPNDSRITRLGNIFRKSRIDELPQLWNILRGEMSFIGPRPEAEVLSMWYEEQIPFYRYRHIILPGITGWAQVNQGHVSEVEEVKGKLNYDFYYIKNFSPWLDLLIVAKTVKTMLTGFGYR